MNQYGLILAATLLLCGCAGNEVWDKPGATQADLNRDWARCEMGAAGIPQPSYQPSNPTSYNAYTNCYGSSCTTTITPGPDYSAFANAGAALGHVIAKNRYMKNCLIALGWTPQDYNNTSRSEFKARASEVNIDDFQEVDHNNKKQYLKSDTVTGLYDEPLMEGKKVGELKVGDLVLVTAEHPTGWIKIIRINDNISAYAHRNWMKG